jgi:hypothetical protein
MTATLRARLARRGIEPIIPARLNHQRATHQDGRKLRRYRRRWVVAMNSHMPCSVRQLKYVP